MLFAHSMLIFTLVFFSVLKAGPSHPRLHRARRCRRFLCHDCTCRSLMRRSLGSITHRIHGAGIYGNIGCILMGSMLPYIAAPWIRHGSGAEINGIALSTGIQMDYPLVNIQKAIENYH